MQLEKKLDNMLDSVWMYKLECYRMIDYSIVENTVTIITDKKDFNFHKKHIDLVLEEWLPVSDEKPVTRKKNTMPIVLGHEQLPNLTNLVLGNIDKLKTDSSFIKQAQAINQSILTLINITKMQINLAKFNENRV